MTPLPLAPQAGTGAGCDSGFWLARRRQRSGPGGLRTPNRRGGLAGGVLPFCRPGTRLVRPLAAAQAGEQGQIARAAADAAVNITECKALRCNSPLSWSACGLSCPCSGILTMLTPGGQMLTPDSCMSMSTSLDIVHVMGLVIILQVQPAQPGPFPG